VLLSRDSGDCVAGSVVAMFGADHAPPAVQAVRHHAKGNWGDLRSALAPAIGVVLPAAVEPEPRPTVALGEPTRMVHDSGVLHAVAASKTYPRKVCKRGQPYGRSHAL
jgi:hypothetical protein